MLESLGYKCKQILFNLPVRHIYERLQADDDSIKAQITMFLDVYYIIYINDYFAGLVSWKLP